MGGPAMFAGAKKLGNLCVIVDNNNLQIDGTIEEVNNPYPIDRKFEAFNFHGEQCRLARQGTECGRVQDRHGRSGKDR